MVILLGFAMYMDLLYLNDIVFSNSALFKKYVFYKMFAIYQPRMLKEPTPLSPTLERATKTSLSFRVFSFAPISHLIITGKPFETINAKLQLVNMPKWSRLISREAPAHIYQRN